MSHCNYNSCLQCHLPLVSAFLLLTIYQWDLPKYKAKGAGLSFSCPSIYNRNKCIHLILHEERHFTKSTSRLSTKTPYFLKADFWNTCLSSEKMQDFPCSTLHSSFVRISLFWKLLSRNVKWHCFSAAELCHSLTPKQVFSSLLNGKIFWVLLEDKTTRSSAAALTSLLVSQSFPGKHNTPLFPAVPAAFSFPDFEDFILKL